MSTENKMAGNKASGMFSRKIRVQYGKSSHTLQACPLKWLDNFAMRNFTNDPIFDDTLPVSDGVMEIGTHVPLDRLRDSMEEWFRKKTYLDKEEKIMVEE
jgi:hypothetical protein